MKKRLSGNLTRREVDAVVEMVADQPRLVDELCRLTSDTDRKVARNALWVCEKLSEGHSEWFVPRYDEWVERLSACPTDGGKRLLLSLLSHLPLPSPPSVALLNFCFRHGFIVPESPGVQALCLRMAYRMCVQVPELFSEWNAYLESLNPTDLPKAVQAVIRNLKA